MNTQLGSAIIPTLGNPKTLFRTAELGGGFRLHLRKTEAFKTIAARLVFHANLDDDTAARALVPRVLARGTTRFPSLRELQIELDRLYGATLSGETRKIGERQLVQFRAEWVTDRLADEALLDKMARILSEYIHDPAGDTDGRLRAEMIEQERKVMADEAASVIDDKGRYSRHRLVEEMCRGEAFARPAIGRIEEIKEVGVEDVRRGYAALVGRAPVDLFLVGDLRWSDARRFALSLGFDGARRPARLQRTGRRRPSRVRTVREKSDIGQAKLAMGYRTRVRVEGELHPALALMNTLFGGSAVGKLFKEVREKASLCYSIGSVVERTKGLLLVHAGIDPADYARARRLIQRQLDALRRGEVAEETLEQARGILLSAVNSLHDSPGGLTDFALECAVNGVPANLDGLRKDLARTTLREVARAARTIELDTVYLLRN